MANEATQQPAATPTPSAGMSGAISSGANNAFAGEKAVEIHNLVKRYRNLITREWIPAVNDISLEVSQGEIFGFLGPNGAGKTTTIKALLGLIFPDGGDVKVLGLPPGDNAVKHQISYLPESPYFYEHMSAREVITFYASLFGLKGNDANKRVDYLIDLVGLTAAGNKPLRAFSKGMLQRVGIAQSLVNDPKVLFFDEPTSGLDPLAHSDIRDLILHLKNEGRTLFLSSHQLSDVEMVCDRVSILYRGKIRKMGHVEDLIAGGKVEILADNLKADEAAMTKLKAISESVEPQGVSLLITSDGSTATKNQILDWVRANKGDVLSMTPTRRTLEDIFIETVRSGEAEAGEAVQFAKTGSTSKTGVN